MVFECQTSLCKSNRFVIVTTLMARTRKHRQMSEPSRQNYEGQSWFCCNPWAKAMSRPSPLWATTHMVNTCCCQMFGDGRVKADPHGCPGRFLSECSHAKHVPMPFTLKEGGKKQVFYCYSTEESSARATSEERSWRSARGSVSITRLSPRSGMPHDAAIMPTHL